MRFRHGRSNLVTGLTFPVTFLFARQAIPPHINNLLFARIFSDAFLIIGRAAMGEPITVLVCEFWPIIRQKHIYEKISTMDIGIVPLLP